MSFGNMIATSKSKKKVCPFLLILLDFSLFLSIFIVLVPADQGQLKNAWPSEKGENTIIKVSAGGSIVQVITETDIFKIHTINNSNY